jgi:hypothetical protein
MPFASKIAFAFLSIPIAVFALDSEFDVHYRLGITDLSTLSHTPGISFAVYPWKNFGFASGLDYSIRQKTNTGGPVQMSRVITDKAEDEIKFTYYIDEYEEKLQANTFQIPVLLKFRWDYFYIAAGVKIGLPQDMNAKFSYNNLTTEGCVYGVCIDSLPYMGFYKNKDSSATTKITLKTLYMLTAESGVRIKFTENLALVLGAYADYSLNHGFKRDLPGVEWNELAKDSATIKVNDNWKSWKPWSVGGDARLSYSTSSTMVTAGITILIFDFIVAFMMLR